MIKKRHEEEVKKGRKRHRAHITSINKQDSCIEEGKPRTDEEQEKREKEEEERGKGTERGA